jgi:hypothetical protein
MEDLAWKQAEMTRELKSARTWLIVVGAIQFAMDLLILHVLQMPTGLGNATDPVLVDIRTRYTIYAAVLFAAFVGLWIYSKQKPKLCLILALVVFWGVHLWVIAQDPENAYRGIIIKVLFTMALIKGIKSASRSEELSKELGKVFE